MQNFARDELIADIYRVELSKTQVTVERSEQLGVAYGNLKIMDAHAIDQHMIYVKKRLFDYREKAGKQLVWVLSSISVNSSASASKTNGELTKDISEKLGFFQGYYQELYASSSI